MVLASRSLAPVENTTAMGGAQCNMQKKILLQKVYQDEAKGVDHKADHE